MVTLLAAIAGKTAKAIMVIPIPIPINYFIIFFTSFLYKDKNCTKKSTHPPYRSTSASFRAEGRQKFIKAVCFLLFW
jgi:hypothetical protein